MTHAFLEELESVLRDTADLVKDRQPEALNPKMPPDRESAWDDPDAIFRRRLPGCIVPPSTGDILAQQPVAAERWASEERQVAGAQLALDVDGDGVGRWMLFVRTSSVVKESWDGDQLVTEDFVDRTPGSFVLEK